MKILFAFVFTSLLWINAFAQEEQKPDEKRPAWLFNGRNLMGWTVHGTEKWYVEKGDLVCESGPEKSYE